MSDTEFMPAADLPAEAASNRQVLIAAFVSCFGWALDLYDLVILLYVAPIVGRLFFPSDEPLLSMAAVFASFGVTLVMRPVGSAWFGSYADRRGRKGALMLAVSLAGLVTLLLGVLPTLSQIGILAPVLFIALRLAQGIFIGGVTACTGTVGVEAISERWRGFMSGVVGGGGGAIGGMLASAVFWITTSSMSGEAFADWGWRIMFLAGIASSLIGLTIAHTLEESPIWLKLRAERAAKGVKAVTQRPIRLILSRQHRALFLSNMPLVIAAGAGYYLTSGYLPTYLKVVLHLHDHHISLILFLTSLGGLFSSLAVGQLSQMIGRRPVFIWLGVARLLILLASVLLMVSVPSLVMAGAIAVVFGSLGNASYAPLLVLLNERFPTALRASGVGLSWNVGFAIGGMAPTITSLSAHSVRELPIVLAIFLTVTSVLYLIGAFIVPETRGNMSR